MATLTDIKDNIAKVLASLVKIKEIIANSGNQALIDEVNAEAAKAVAAADELDGVEVEPDPA